MNSHLWPIVAVLGLFCGQPGVHAADEAEGNWQEYKSEKHKFLAKFPGKVVVTEKGDTTKVIHAQEKAEFTVACTFTERIVPEKGLLPELRRARDVMARNVKGKVSNAKDIKIQGRPAVEFKLTIDQGKVVCELQYHMTMVEDRLYQQIVIVDQGVDAAEDTRKFFDSLRLDIK